MPHVPTMGGVVLPPGTAWRAFGARGFAHLSPPEAIHAVLELPANRAEYIGVLQDMGDYPARSPIGQRVPAADEVAALAGVAGRWRAIVLLEDERALRTAAGLFSRVFVLDPFYDSGALLYAAWHDPAIKDEHSRRLAEQAGLLVRAAPVLNAGTAILTPDHLPGSWNPRPGWRKPRPTEDKRQVAAWAMRTTLVMVYWADRLDGVVCTARADVAAALDVVLGPRTTSSALDVAEPARMGDAQATRAAMAADLAQRWASVRRISRLRARMRLTDVADALTSLAEALGHPTEPHPWRLSLGAASLPEPAMLIRRVLTGEDPERPPPLPRTRVRRRPLCLIAASSAGLP
ncbi:MAG: hypothetical protein LC797_12910 [Chloroflexi bacterium]|nr:hypothetical protein [Chloroflexota bacterium]